MSSYLEFLANFGIGGAHPGGLPLTQKLLAKESIQPWTKVLDAGCGTGQTSAYLARTFHCDVTALDYHSEMVNKAKNRFEHEQLDIQLVQESVEQLPFAEQTFDFVLAESVTVFTTIQKTLHEYARILKPGGILMMIEMTKKGQLTNSEIKQVCDFYGVKEVLAEADWYQKISEAGFHTVETSYTEGYQHSTLEKVSDFNLSHTIDFDMFQVWMEHQEIMERLGDRLTYRVYRAKK